MIFTAWVCTHPAPLEGVADPSKAYEVRPEWYFMFLFQALRYFHGPYEVVGTFVLPSLFFGILFFWPLLDRTPSRDPRRRPVAMALLTLGIVGLIGLTIFALASDVRMTKPAVALEPKAAAPPLQKVDVVALYTTHCVACHGVDGTGNALRVAFPTLPDLTSATWQQTQSEKDFVVRIRDGKDPAMPAFKDKLDSDQIRALAVYARAFVVKDDASK